MPRRIGLATVMTLSAAIVAAMAAGQPATRVSRSSDAVLVFAAASLQTAIDELAERYRTITGTVIRASYAASSTLANQIVQGAPAEIFISADLDWMDFVESRGGLQPNSRVNLLGNDLVLVAPAASAVQLAITEHFAIAGALGSGRLAVADPSAVPAGKYAKAALTSLGVWNDVAHRLAPAENVRAALLLVSRGEAPLGIVYRSDARADLGVRIVDVFPDATHPAIIYPAALTRHATGPAQKVFDYLRGPTAREVFERQGFRTDVSPPR